jgi:hypothetical protein
MDEDQREFLATKWVRIMCEWTCEGIWDKTGIPRSIEDLPVSEVLQARIMAWQERYEEIDGLDECDFNAPPVIPDRSRWIAFSADGLKIAQEVKRELPDWTVMYHDEFQGKTIGPVEAV